MSRRKRIFITGNGKRRIATREELRLLAIIAHKERVIDGLIAASAEKWKEVEALKVQRKIETLLVDKLAEMVEPRLKPHLETLFRMAQRASSRRFVNLRRDTVIGSLAAFRRHEVHIPDIHFFFDEELPK